MIFPQTSVGRSKGVKEDKDVERGSSPEATAAFAFEVNPDVSREELQRVFKRAAIPSIFLTLTVMIVRALFHQRSG